MHILNLDSELQIWMHSKFLLKRKHCQNIYCSSWVSVESTISRLILRSSVNGNIKMATRDTDVSYAYGTPGNSLFCYNRLYITTIMSTAMSPIKIVKEVHIVASGLLVSGRLWVVFVVTQVLCGLCCLFHIIKEQCGSKNALSPPTPQLCLAVYHRCREKQQDSSANYLGLSWMSLNYLKFPV